MNVFIFLKIYVTFRFVRLARRSRISNAHQKTVDGPFPINHEDAQLLPQQGVSWLVHSIAQSQSDLSPFRQHDDDEP